MGRDRRQREPRTDLSAKLTPKNWVGHNHGSARAVESLTSSRLECIVFCGTKLNREPDLQLFSLSVYPFYDNSMFLGMWQKQLHNMAEVIVVGPGWR